MEYTEEQIKAIETKGCIIKYSNWHYLKDYIPLFDKIIELTEPKDSFDKYWNKTSSNW